MNARDVEFNRKAVRPLECMRAGWRLIKDDYWLFLGITVGGLFLGSLGPMGILMGPAFCGIYLCLFTQESRQPVSFSLLLQGFNYFGQSLIATLVMIVPVMVLMGFFYLVFFGGMFAMFAFMGQQPRNQPPDTGLVIGIIALSTTVGFVFGLLMGFVQALFFFAFPLIVDKDLSGLDAVKLSIRAVLANLWGVVGLMLLMQLLSMLGLLVCIVGVYLELPLQFAMMLVAYRQVFPRREFLEDIGDEDEPPPLADAPPLADTAVKADAPGPTPSELILPQ